MKGIVVVTSEGPRGPAYIRFSREPVASTAATEAQDEVVGVEFVSLGPEMFAALADVARKHDLDLSAWLARPFAVPPQAA